MHGSGCRHISTKATRSRSWEDVEWKPSRLTRRARIRWGGEARDDNLAMNLLLLLAVAIPLSCCLAFLSLLAFLGVMTIGAVIHVVGIARAGRQQRPRVEPANSSAG